MTEFVTYLFANFKKRKEKKRKEEKLVANTKHLLICSLSLSLHYLWFIFIYEKIITISFKLPFMNILKYYIFILIINTYTLTNIQL